MFNKKEFSKIYLAGLFLLLLIISVFAALIFEKTQSILKKSFTISFLLAIGLAKEVITPTLVMIFGG